MPRASRSQRLPTVAAGQAAAIPPYTAPATVPATQTESVDIGRLVDAMRHQWRRIAVGVAAGVALAIAFVRLTVPRYEATSTVRIDARQNTLPTIYTEQSTRDEVFTEIEVLHSWTIASDVVDSLSLQLEVLDPRRVPRSTLFSALKVVSPTDTGEFRLIKKKDGRYADEKSGALVTPGRPFTLHGVRFTIDPRATRFGALALRVQPRDEAIADLRRQVDVGRAGLQASIIALHFRSVDPQLARDVLNVWTSRFIKRRQSIQSNEATNTATFIQAQLDTLNPELAMAEDRLLAYREANHIVSPEYEANTQVTKYAQLQAERNEIEAERSALSQAFAHVRTSGPTADDAPSPYRQLLGFPTLLRNQAASELLRALSSLDDQRTTLLIKRTAQDPDVVTITERIRVVEGQLKALTETYLRGLTSQVAAADASLGAYASRLREMPAQQVEYARLQRAPHVYEEMVSLLQTRLKEAQITEAVKDPSVRIVDLAVAPTRPSSPNVPLSLAFGLAGGLLFGAGMALWREHSVSTVRTRLDLQELSDIPVLGIIPGFDLKKQRRGRPRLSKPAAPLSASSLASVHTHGGSVSDLAATEAFVRLHMNLQWATGRPIRSLLLTSPLPGDGKTTSVLHLGAAAASQQRRVLLIDADLRCGGLTKTLGIRERSGLVDFLTGGAALSDIVHRVELPGGWYADAIGAGSLSRDSGVPQTVRGLGELLVQAVNYDLVLIDTPPVNVVADAAALAALTDGALLIARAGVTSPAAIEIALEQLQRAGGRVIGSVLNDAEFKRSEGYGSIGQYRAYVMARA